MHLRNVLQDSEKPTGTASAVPLSSAGRTPSRRPVGPVGVAITIIQSIMKATFSRDMFFCFRDSSKNMR